MKHGCIPTRAAEREPAALPGPLRNNGGGMTIGFGYAPPALGTETCRDYRDGALGTADEGSARISTLSFFSTASRQLRN
jgi:hypothetical protein